MQAVIFDMDGVLIDSEIVYDTLAEAFFATRGLNMPRDARHALIGSSNKTYWETVGKRNPHIDPAEICVQYHEYKKQAGFSYKELLNPGAEALLMGLSKRGYGIALATSNSRMAASAFIKECGLGHYLGAVVCGDEVENGKPAPDIFIKAAQMLNAPPESCVVIEDSYNGICAAKAANMMVIAREDVRFCQDISLATVKVRSLEELTAARVAELWSTFRRSLNGAAR